MAKARHAPGTLTNPHMIRRCRLLRNSPQSCFYQNAPSCRSASRHIQASATTNSRDDSPIAANNSLVEPTFQERKDHTYEGDLPNTPHLHPVLQFRDALFEAQSPLPKPEWMRALRGSIAARGDARNVATWLRGRQSPLKISDINALQARLQYLGEVPGPRGILQSMLSVAGNPAAMKQRLLAHEAATDKTVSLPDYCQLAFRRICTSLEASPLPQGNRWHDQYIRQQWLHVITGWNRGGVGELGEQRAWCLYNLGPNLDPYCWKIYLELLGRFGTSNAVYNEWMIYQQMHGVRVEALNSTIQSLIKLEDPKKAWCLAYEFGDGVKSVNGETWELLLAHPKYIKEWIPCMNAPALRMLDNELRKVERQFGLRWEGGESGYHKTDGSLIRVFE